MAAASARALADCSCRFGPPGSGRAWSRCHGNRSWRLTCGGGAWREWPGLRTVGPELVPPGAGSRGGQVV